MVIISLPDDLFALSRVAYSWAQNDRPLRAVIRLRFWFTFVEQSQSHVTCHIKT